MTIFEVLLMAHLIGDWLLQTEWQAKNKEYNWMALVIHILIYHIIIVLALVIFFNFDKIMLLWIVLSMAVIHAILDRRKSVIWLMKTLRITAEREPSGWLLIAVDQSLHLLLLGIVAQILSTL